MKKFFVAILMTSVLISCKSDAENGGSAESDDVKDLKNQIAQLKLDQQLKDSVINESLAFFNEIQSNLEAIGLKKDEIRLRSDDPEFQSDDKQWILEEIRHINYLREENARKVQHLNDQLKKSGLKIKEMEALIERLVNDIQVRDEQIAGLQAEMEKMDQDLKNALLEIADKTHKKPLSIGTRVTVATSPVADSFAGFVLQSAA